MSQNDLQRTDSRLNPEGCEAGRQGLVLASSALWPLPQSCRLPLGWKMQGPVFFRL